MVLLVALTATLTATWKARGWRDGKKPSLWMIAQGTGDASVSVSGDGYEDGSVRLGMGERLVARMAGTV
jgi:hypothetical protein